MDTMSTNKEPSRTRDDDGDTVSLYMRDVRRRERLGRDEEMTLAREMVACREKIADVLRAVLLKACDTLALDTAAGSRARARATKSAP